MDTQDVAKLFMDAAENWLCDGYFAHCQYIAEVRDSEFHVWNASLVLRPAPWNVDNSFSFESGTFAAGLFQRIYKSRKAAIRVLDQAVRGVIELPHGKITVPHVQPLDLYSDMTVRDRWSYESHIRVSGSRRPSPSSLELSKIDGQLRSAPRPFDGLTDLCAWLSLKSPESSSDAPHIAITVHPPVNLIFDESGLSANKLRVSLIALTKFDVSRVGLAVRCGATIGGRQQIAEQITWRSLKDGTKRGTVEIDLPNAESALVVLMIGESTVRRQWFNDPNKSPNQRYLAIQHFDRELKMVKHAVLESLDSSKFEAGIASILYMLGFDSAVQLETDSPDLIVTTPGGRLAVVECTTRISDFQSKLGKLVDRRGSLRAALKSGGHVSDVVAVLVCRLPLDQIPVNAARDVANQRAILITGEDLTAAFQKVQYPNNADAQLEQAITRIESAQANLM